MITYATLSYTCQQYVVSPDLIFKANFSVSVRGATPQPHIFTCFRPLAGGPNAQKVKGEIVVLTKACFAVFNKGQRPEQLRMSAW